ncbi:MAG: flagellar biosynthesis protein FlhA, partial [Brevinematales bacterium]
MANDRQSLFFSMLDEFPLAIAVVVIVLMMVIPLPAWMLDVMLALNLAISLMIILSTLSIRKPADFHTFPTLILLTTIFGLGLNVSSTRLILSQGVGFQGKIIRAFGEFVVGGNYWIGITIFIVLLAIQFLVITKGASRVSEVAARFTLDAMPAKQLSIDSDLNAGLITEDEARKRREEVRQEADFYGAMDGSSKFVSGNVKVALVITLVDIIMGIVIGTVVRGEDIATAAQTYTLLTIGDGLVSQIPALLISTATGIIVTRSASQERFGRNVVKQIASTSSILYITGGVLGVMALLPGFPTFIMLVVGGGLVALGYMMQSAQMQEEVRKKQETKTKQATEQTTTVEDIVRVDPMNLEIGYNLIPLVDKQQGGDLLDRIRMIRKRIGLDLGVLVPPIRIVDNVALDASEYVIKIRGIDIARGKVYPSKFLAMNARLDLDAIDGISVKEPAFGLPAKWISAEERVKAESLGFSVYDAPAVIATHLTEVIKRNAASLLTRQDTQSMLDAIRKEYPVVVEEALKHMSVGDIQKVLQGLLREGVRIRNMVTILETLSDYGSTTKNIDTLVEYVRQALGKQIVGNYVDEKNTLKAVMIDPELEEILQDSIYEQQNATYANLDPEIMNHFVQEASQIIENAIQNGYSPVILCSQRVRRLVREMIERIFPSVGVISYSEV